MESPSITGKFPSYLWPMSIKVCSVSFINSLPFRQGLLPLAEEGVIHYYEKTPSEGAKELISGRADIGLVPVAVLKELLDYRLASDFGIAANGPVKSVLLVGHCPREEMEKVVLDYRSRTSVLLLKILSRDKWKSNPEMEKGKGEFYTRLEPRRGTLVIGDLALKIRDRFPYVYDLSQEWKELTGLPFVFAVWVARKTLPGDFLKKFNQCLKNGIQGIPTYYQEGLINKEESDYIKDSIHYTLGEQELKGMRLFLEQADALV